MQGGAGDDIYIVDHVGDTATDSSGFDTVKSSVTYTLGSGIEVLTLTGTANINGTGNALDNSLDGNSGNNILDGRIGNDTLDGGLGADTMIGGAGDDFYAVDNVGDVVTELAGGGNDVVFTTLNTLVLAANAEILFFAGTGDFIGTGNSLDNILLGGAGNDVPDYPRSSTC